MALTSEHLRIFLSAGGVLNCGAMVAMAIFCLLEIDSTDFFTTCYSISQAMLFAAAGVFVFGVEAKVLFPKTGTRLAGFVLNKLGRAGVVGVDVIVTTSS